MSLGSVAAGAAAGYLFAKNSVGECGLKPQMIALEFAAEEANSFTNAEVSGNYIFPENTGTLTEGDLCSVDIFSSFYEDAEAAISVVFKLPDQDPITMDLNVVDMGGAGVSASLTIPVVTYVPGTEVEMIYKVNEVKDDQATFIVQITKMIDMVGAQQNYFVV